MSNLYSITKKIHQLLPQVKAKYGLDFDINIDKVWSEKTERFVYFFPTHKEYSCFDYLFKIETPQIKQILIALKEVLGENPEYIKPEFTSWVFDDEITDEDRLSSYKRGLREGRYNSTKSQVEALCSRWLDGLTPFFDQYPIFVLTELVEILENLLSQNNLMQNPQLIQFLLHQLTTNEQDRKNFNLVSYLPCQYISRIKAVEFGDTRLGENPVRVEYVIRRCLSRINGKAVLKVFRGLFYNPDGFEYWKTVDLYEAFDYPLRNGKPLDTAISALHDKMLELVPEYGEFLNNKTTNLCSK